MPYREWPDLGGRRLRTEDSKRILVVVWVGCISEWICDSKFTTYQCHKIPMTKNALLGVAGAWGTPAEDNRFEGNSCCAVGRVHFHVDL